MSPSRKVSGAHSGPSSIPPTITSRYSTNSSRRSRPTRQASPHPPSLRKSRLRTLIHQHRRKRKQSSGTTNELSEHSKNRSESVRDLPGHGRYGRRRN